MAKLPEPPPADRLAALPPAHHVLSAGTRCWRIYFQRGPHATAWNALRGYGPASARFDHHLPPPRAQSRQVLYMAENILTCFAEVFQETRSIDRSRNDPWLVCCELVRAVPLLDLTGPWPTRAGASMAINSGPRPRARRWSQAIYDAYPAVEGLYYASSMDANRPAVVLYERAADALASRPSFHRALADPTLTPAIVRAAQRFNYVVT
ncbi:MAG TPA: RES family NAD+ phosphorylase [Methylomirabilota bacterium]|nr:RES family NAD+ phosphorylase [Methylomirabilota bacterium]